MSPLGACMVKGQTLRGFFDEFEGADEKLKEKIGPVLCIPLAFTEEHLVGGIGIGRKKGKGAFDFWDEANLRAAGNILSLIVGMKVVQDMLNRERKTVSELSELINTIFDVSDTEKRLQLLAENVSKIFGADFVFLGRIDKVKKLVKPIVTIGLESPNDIPIGKGMSGIVAMRGKPHLFLEFPGEIPKGYEKEAAKVGSAMAIPVLVEGKPEFVFVLARSKTRPTFVPMDFQYFILFQRVLNLIFEIMKKDEERQRLERLRARVERLDAISTLAGGIAHDFNNIIGVIMGSAQLGYEIADDPQVKEYFEYIYKQCSHAAVLTSQILSVSRGALGEQKSPLELRSAVKGAIKMLERMFPENIKIVYEDDGKAPYAIFANPFQVHSMLLNLAANARDAMPNGGTLRFRLRKDRALSILDDKVESVVVLEVEDTGEGIPEDVIDRIFDPFFTTKEPGKGTGLGLAQVHRTVRDIGGIIEVESEPG